MEGFNPKKFIEQRLIYRLQGRILDMIPKEKSHTQFMVECLMEEVTKSPYKFNEQTTEFIKSLATRFFNDPDYQLSEAQLKWLTDIWSR